jgi:hypothetical protein
MLRIFKKYIVLFVLITAVYNTYSYAATKTVPNLNDIDAGSSRRAIKAANLDAVKDKIVFTTGLMSTITLASNLPTIANSSIMTGLGFDQLTITSTSLCKMLIVVSGKVLAISKFNFTNSSLFNYCSFCLNCGR